MRWSLEDEAALRAGGDDDGVLDRLRLHQPEDLGAEVLAPVRPADPAAGDLARAEMDALHPRRVDEDLEHRPRGGQVGDARRVELEGEVRLRLAVVAALEVVRPQHRLDHAEEAAQDPVLVEAGDRVEPRLDLPDELVGLRLRVFASRRLEAEAEELHEQARELGFAASASSMYAWLNVLPAWRRYLAIARRSATSCHVSSAPRTSRLKPSFSIAPRHAWAKASWKIWRTRSAWNSTSGAVVEAEVVDPDGRSVQRAHLEGPLVGDPGAHVLEQRQQVGEEDRPAGAEQLERQMPGRRLEGEVQAQVQVALGVETLDPLDVGHGHARGEVGPVGGRERVGVARVEVRARSSPSCSISASWRSSDQVRVASASRASIAATS